MTSLFDSLTLILRLLLSEFLSRNTVQKLFDVTENMPGIWALGAQKLKILEIFGPK
jgi:hypothetical protein